MSVKLSLVPPLRRRLHLLSRSTDGESLQLYFKVQSRLLRVLRHVILHLSWRTGAARQDGGMRAGRSSVNSLAPDLPPSQCLALGGKR